MASRPTTAARVETLADYRPLCLTAYYRKCERYRRFDPAELARQFGPGATLALLRRRLRCTECGRPGQMLVDGSDEASRTR